MTNVSSSVSLKFLSEPPQLFGAYLSASYISEVTDNIVPREKLYCVY